MPHKNIRKVVREVVEAIIEEFVNVLIRCPTTEQGWKQQTICIRVYQMAKSLEP